MQTYSSDSISDVVQVFVLTVILGQASVGIVIWLGRRAFMQALGLLSRKALWMSLEGLTYDGFYFGLLYGLLSIGVFWTYYHLPWLLLVTAGVALFAYVENHYVAAWTRLIVCTGFAFLLSTVSWWLAGMAAVAQVLAGICDFKGLRRFAAWTVSFSPIMGMLAGWRLFGHRRAPAICGAISAFVVFAMWQSKAQKSGR